jgi:glycosyltransferase involved in cell wall biosynthesis
MGDELRVCIVTRIVNAHAVGGMQQHTDDLARGLLAAGHQVTILTPRLPAGAPKTPAGASWALVDVDLPSLPYSRPWGRRSAELYAGLAAETPFDVVHSESTGAMGLVRAGLPGNAALVAKFHGNFHGYVRAQFRQGWRAHRRGHGLLRAARRSARTAAVHYGQGHWRAFRDVEGMVPAGSQLADTLRSTGIRPERMHVVPNGVDVDAFRPGSAPELRREWGVPRDAVVVMTLGRLALDKGNDVAIRAMRALPERATLVIVGDGEEEEPLRRLSAEMGLDARVRLVGRVDQRRVPEALRAADVFWFPTVRDEAAGLVLTQAMATGLPVVAARSGAVPDYVPHPGREAVLVPVSDPDALAAATLPLLRSTEARLRMGAQARTFVGAEYSLQRVTERTVAVYRLAMARRGAE